MSEPISATPAVEDESIRLEQEDREVLEHFKSLETALQAATAIATTVSDGMTKEDLSKELQTIQNDVDGVRKYLSLWLPPKIYNERRRADSTVAQSVLNISELLELVLIHVDIDTILSMRQVSREIRNSIDASPTLLVKLNFKAANPSMLQGQHYTTCFNYNSRELNVEIEGPVGRQAPKIYVNLDFEDETCKLPNIGAVWKRMLICQPPIKELKAYRHCTNHSTCSGNGLPVESETGITVGDLYDAAMLFSEGEPPCSTCHWENTRETASGEAWLVRPAKPRFIHFTNAREDCYH